jgi:hypothetical protein
MGKRTKGPRVTPANVSLAEGETEASASKVKDVGRGGVRVRGGKRRVAALGRETGSEVQIVALVAVTAVLITVLGPSTYSLILGGENSASVVLDHTTSEREKEGKLVNTGRPI